MKNHTFLLVLSLVLPMILGLTKKDKEIVFVLLGDVKQSDVVIVKRALKTYYNVDLKQLKVDSIPSNVYYNNTDTLDARSVLSYLETSILDAKGNVVALTEKAITIGNGPGWTIRGFTRFKVNSLISTSKIKLESEGPKEYRNNLIKVTRHEYGHLLGLDHCTQSATCLMRHAYNEKDAFLMMGQEMCQQCKEKVSASLK